MTSPRPQSASPTEDPEQATDDNVAIPRDPTDYDWAECRARPLGRAVPVPPEQAEWFTPLPGPG
ncbi:hypothetical protein GCM10023205_25440 [Yinghuangia aomiensis]|uniref:Uncharacterized protein n=1 Tax=Yinghuangia aomiensis TaxID=676205 RepID=A0ABP9H3S7_9ACTN